MNPLIQSPSSSSPVTKGWLRRRSAHIGAWRRRYVVLTPMGLSIYSAETDAEATKRIPLDTSCKIGDREMNSVRGSTGFYHPNHSIFSITLPDGTKEFFAAETELEGEKWVEGIKRMFSNANANNNNPPVMRQISGTSNTTSTPQVNDTTTSKTNNSGSSSSTTKPTVSFESKIENNNNTSWGSAPSKTQKREILKKRLLRSASVGTFLPTGTGKKSLELISKAQWQEVLVSNGVRIFSEVGLTREFPCLRVSCVLPCSPDRAFNVINDLKLRSKWDGLVDVTHGIRILNESDDGHFRKYHVKNRGQYVHGWWTTPRDYVLESSWRREDDGSFVIIEQSPQQNEEPPQPGFVRARFFAQGFTICPRRRKLRVDEVEYDPEDEQGLDNENSASTSITSPSSSSGGGGASYHGDEDCLLQLAIHADPGGWLSHASRDWGQEWLYALMLRVVGLREAIEFEKYRAVDFNAILSDTSSSSSTPANSSAGTITAKHGPRKRKPVPPTPGAVGSARAVVVLPSDASSSTTTTTNAATTTTTSTTNIPISSSSAGSSTTSFEITDYHSTIPQHHWCNSDEPFKVRGPTYLRDKVKIASSEPLFDLVGLDLFQVQEGQEICAGELKSAVASQILSQPNHPFLFMVQFQVPGSPPLCFIAYFLARPGSIEGPSPFAELFSDFIEGDEQYRDTHFKLIPRVVKGSYIVKTTVGQTPAILGTKLVQSYRQGTKWFEVIVDVGSSSVAGGVLSVVKGYVKTITVDLAFLIEPHKDNELPEAVLGAMQFHSLDLGMAVPLPPQQ
jgi:hypothetical protein